ncbi:MAG: alkylation response protein AidB-like acyl-CoA dehydrogenase, partial [Planctomycetota bacterium]
MDFYWTEEQGALAKEAVEFARRELTDDVIQRDAEGAFSRDLWKRAAAYGVLGWAVPKEHGGAGHDLVTAVRLLEALGEGCRDNGLTFGLGAQMWGVQTALLHFGTEAQI